MQVPLTPGQSYHFFINPSSPHYHNLNAAFTFEEEIDVALLERSFRRTVEANSSFRMRFRREAGEWTQFTSTGVDPVKCVVLETCDNHTPLQQLALKWQQNFDLETGPLVALGIQQDTRGRTNVLVTVNHLVCDGISLTLLLDSWLQRYDGAGHVAEPTGAPFQFGEWCNALSEYTLTSHGDERLQYWSQHTHANFITIPPDTFVNRESLMFRDNGELVLRLNEEQTSAIAQACVERGVVIAVVLLTALSRVCEEFGNGHLPISIVDSGRTSPLFAPAIINEFDLTEQSGYFAIFPTMFLPVQKQYDYDGLLGLVADHLESIGMYGFDFACASFGQNKRWRSLVGKLPTPTISFNYEGPISNNIGQRIIRDLDWLKPNPTSPSARKFHPLTMNAAQVGGQIEIRLVYNRKMYRGARILDFMSKLASELTVIAHR